MNGGSEHLNGCSQGVRVESQIIITNIRYGNRSVTLSKGLAASALQAHAQVDSALFGQCGLHVADLLFDLLVEHVPLPIEL